jgi:hypothetical protein
MCKLFKHEQQETHLDTKIGKTNMLSWIFRVFVLWVDMSFHSETLF